MLPKVVESVVNELSNGTRKLQICIQVDPGVKASEFSSPYLDEVIRVDAFSFDALERKLVERREPALLVLDLWGFLFAENLLKLMQDLRPAFNLARRTLILMPKPWLGQWETSVVTQSMSRTQRAELDVFFQRLIGSFEILWNTDGPEIYCVQSAPTFELLELATGQPGLVPRKVLGVHLLPKECRNFPARMASVAKLTHEVLSFLNLPIPGPGEHIEREAAAPWVCNVDSDVIYGPVQPRLDGRSVFSKLSPELIAAGVQSRTPVLDQGLLTMSCRWDRYLRMDAAKKQFWTLSSSVLTRTGSLNFPSPEAASWLYFLGTLEQTPVSDVPNKKRGRNPNSASSFPSIYQTGTAGSSAEEIVLG
jgi:hypothetical protein